jgi:hypothetical protein
MVFNLAIYHYNGMTAVEKVLLHEREAWLTSERLIIRNEQIKLDQIEKAWVERLTLVVRLNDGEERRFGWEPIAAGTPVKQTSFNLSLALAVHSYIHSQLEFLAHTINRRIGYIKTGTKESGRFID